MQAFWIKFQDGSAACCEGQSAGDAASIAEHLSGKSVLRKDGHEAAPTWQGQHLEVATLPYPASPAVWQFEHPVHGKTPGFCMHGDRCAGRGSCPRPHACDD